MTKRVLVTGATGLIGAMAVRTLAARGYHVIAACCSGTVDGAALVIHADLLNDQDMDRLVKDANASHLVHLAWHGGADRWNSPVNLEWARATARLVREFDNNGGQRVVCAGSCAEYDWSEPVLSEDTALNPRTLYGQAKAKTGELLCGEAKDTGLSLAWARIFFCYGPGEPKGRLLGDLLNGLAQGQVVPCTDGQQERDFLHTADIASALVSVLESDLQGPVNIGSGQATPVAEIIRIAAKKMGRPELIKLGAIPRGADDPAQLVADVSVLESTGFRPDFTLETGIQDCIDRLEMTP